MLYMYIVLGTSRPVFPLSGSSRSQIVHRGSYSCPSPSQMPTPRLCRSYKEEFPSATMRARRSAVIKPGTEIAKTGIWSMKKLSIQFAAGIIYSFPDLHISTGAN